MLLKRRGIDDEGGAAPPRRWASRPFPPKRRGSGPLHPALAWFEARKEGEAPLPISGVRTAHLLEALNQRRAEGGTASSSFGPISVLAAGRGNNPLTMQREGEARERVSPEHLDSLQPLNTLTRQVAGGGLEALSQLSQLTALGRLATLRSKPGLPGSSTPDLTGWQDMAEVS